MKCANTKFRVTVNFVYMVLKFMKSTPHYHVQAFIKAIDSNMSCFLNNKISE